MDLLSLARNVAFALVLFLIAASVSYADLPLAGRLEEYIAFVLTTDFDYERWVEQASGTTLLAGLARWRSALPWLGGGEAEERVPASAPPGPVESQR